jgi:ribosomal protein L3 glutamine methyltransferase
MDAVRTILREAPRFLQSNGILVVEVGHNRENAEAAFPRMPFLWLSTPSASDSVFLLRREDIVAGR